MLALRARVEPGRQTLFVHFESKIASRCSNLPITHLPPMQPVSRPRLSKLVTRCFSRAKKVLYAGGVGCIPFILLWMRHRTRALPKWVSPCRYMLPQTARSRGGIRVSVPHSSTSFGWDKGGNVTSAGWQVTHSTQPCIPPGSLNRVPASAGVRAGMSPLPGGR